MKSRSLPLLLLTGALLSFGQTPPASPPAPPAQDQPLVYRGEPRAADSVFQQSPAARDFRFGKPDLELLRQTDALDRYLEDHGLIYNDPVVTGYVERVARSVTPSQELEHVRWRVRVIRDPIPNAFALPNGSIYVHTGLLSLLRNEAQLAGVLAHESTHVFNRHLYLGYHDMRTKVVITEVLQAGATGAGLAGVNGAVVNAIGNLMPAVLIQTIFGYRRELEHESDIYAVRVMKSAGYDPAEMAKALDLLRNGPEVDLSQESVFWSDHPKLRDRVDDTTALAAQIGKPPGGGATGPLDYSVSTRNAVRHDAGMAMLLGRPRTAVAIAERLIELEPANADNYALLGDAYRSLGARPSKPTADEFTEDGKKRARKMLSKMTLAEYEKALRDAPGGRQQFDANYALALDAYGKALALDANNPFATRGMGFLDEAQGNNRDALVNFNRYLELAPAANDARQVRQHIQKLTALTPSPGAQP